MPPKQNKNQEESISNHITQTIKDLSFNLDERFDRIDVNFTSVNSDLMHIKDNLIQKLVDEITFLRNKVSKLETDMNFNFQKQRENNIEICGIPTEVANDELEKTVVKILSSISCSITPEDIQACHQLPTKNNNKTIMKFVNRKNAELAIRNRQLLKNMETSSLGEKFGNNEKLYINENLVFPKLLGNVDV